jgi:CYTH domain-containing protein
MSQKYSLPEIERRWLVRVERLPPLSAARRRQLQDKYIHDGRLRLRAIYAQDADTIFKLGKKYPRVGTEPEHVVSVYLSAGEYNVLQALPGVVAQKARYAIEGGALDIYEHPHTSPSVFEMEFTSEADAAAYSPPAFVGEEITFNDKYTGYALAQEAR